MPDQTDQPYAQLDPATLAVRDMIGGSRELMGRMAQRMGMNANDMSAIGALVQHGPMGVSELAEHLGIRPASATEMIDRLERSGHVRRERDTVDRRRVVITETEAARAASVQAWLPLIRRINEVSVLLSADERAAILGFVRRVEEVITTFDY